MATQVRPDVFTVNVGNLKPAQRVTVSITYVAKLDRHEKSMRMALPTTIAPRYVTASGMNPIDAMIDGDAMNPMRDWVVPYPTGCAVVELGVVRRRKGAGIVSIPFRDLEVGHDELVKHRLEASQPVYPEPARVSSFWKLLSTYFEE